MNGVIDKAGADAGGGGKTANCATAPALHRVEVVGPKGGGGVVGS
jgi:hypothetical protein